MIPRKLKVKNELLTEAVNNVAKENTPETQKEMLKYLVGSGMLLPVKIMPAAKRDANGYYRFSPKHKVAYATVKSAQYENDPDASYYIAFTDSEEMKAWAGGKPVDSFIAHLDDYAVMLLKPEAQMKGFVINPAGANVVITTAAVRDIIRERDAQAQTES